MITERQRNYDNVDNDNDGDKGNNNNSNNNDINNSKIDNNCNMHNYLQLPWINQSMKYYENNRVSVIKLILEQLIRPIYMN